MAKYFFDFLFFFHKKNPENIKFPDHYYNLDFIQQVF